LTPITSFLQKHQNQLNELDNYNPELVSKQTSGRYDYLKDELMLDTGSTITVTVVNPNLATNIRLNKQPMTMATNAGTKQMIFEADIEGFGTVLMTRTHWQIFWDFPHGKAAQESMRQSLPRQRFSECFRVQTDTGIKEFRITDKGLYTY
jgi:hypothetical protein